MKASRLFAATLVALPGSALAHSPMAGIGEFYGGMLHPLMVLPHMLALLVFALLIGQSGVRAMQLTYPVFMLALTIGLFLAGFSVAPISMTEPVLLVTSTGCGLFVAAQRPPPVFVLALLAGILALLIGMDSGVTGLGRRETFATLLGCWLGAVLFLIVVAGIAELAQRSWQRVALRVLGSWTAASGALVLALALGPVG